MDTYSLSSLTPEEYSNIESEGAPGEARLSVMTLPDSLAGWSYTGERAAGLISPSGQRYKSKRAAIEAVYREEGRGPRWRG